MRLHRHMGRFEKMLENPIQSFDKKVARRKSLFTGVFSFFMPIFQLRKRI